MRLLRFIPALMIGVQFAAAQEVDRIVAELQRAQAACRERMRPYASTRDYTIRKADEERGAVKVVLNHPSPQEFHFEIINSTGGMAERAVRKALENEAQIARAPEVAEITPRNYRFELLGKEWIGGREHYVLAITPHERSKALLNGRIWVDTESYRVRRVAGRVSKNPSFWVKEINLVLNFGEVRGMWLKTDSQAVAQIRWAGEYHFNAQDGDVALLDQPPVVARRTAPFSRVRRTAAALAASEPALQP